MGFLATSEANSRSGVMPSDTIHANDLSKEEIASLQEAAKGSLTGKGEGRLKEFGLVTKKGDEWVITEEGRATLRTLVDPDHPLH